MNSILPNLQATGFCAQKPVTTNAATHFSQRSASRWFHTMLGVAGVVLSTLSAPGLSETVSNTGADPISAYGQKAVYTIKRNGKKIGKHTVEFSKQDEELKVSVISSLTVTVLKIPVYRFRYTSEERWLSGQLQNVIASTTEKGKTTTVSAQRLDERMILQNASGEVANEYFEFSSNHWNPGVLSADRLFNTLTAKVNRIDIEKVGQETLIVSGQPVETTHYRYSGELRVDVWYDTEDRWVKLAFAGSDGSDIEYISDGFGEKS